MTPEPHTPEEQAQRLAVARAALERGDYGQVVRMLQGDGPAEPNHDPEALLLLATAWLGQGRNSDALLCCRRLRACGDATLRAQARELQRVLEAPELKRPREWSLTLPDLAGSDAAMGRQLAPLRRQRRQRPAPPPPPAVGPTRAPLGFAALVVALLLLALLLGGCSSVRSALEFKGAGRLQLHHHLLQNTPTPPAWQQQLSRSLSQMGLQSRREGRDLVLSSAVLPSRQVLDLLQESAVQAARQAGVSLPAPQLELQSRNWLVGVDERFDLRFDLRALNGFGLDLALSLTPLRERSIVSASPLPATPRGDGQLWPLRAGETNQLVVHLWRWNPLGLGGVAIALLLLLSLTLQHLRRVVGYGLPQLPR